MKYVIGLLFLLFFLSNDAQQLDKYRWESRLLVLISNNEDTIASNKLINEIERDTAGLKERKLLIFKVYPNYYSVESEPIEGEALYDKFNPEKVDFKFLLIGLDGRIKLEESYPLSKEDLYKIIDTMPMRASELKGKQ